MRPWMIVLSSAIGALVVVAALAAPELLEAPRSAFGAILVPRLATLAVAALGVYALGVMSLTVGTLVADTLYLRHRLGREGSYRTPITRDWISPAFGSIKLQRLMPRPVAAPARRGGANETILLQGQFDPEAARGEIARLHYIWLARTHFFSALIVLMALIAMGLAQDHGSVPLPAGTIPTISAILIFVGLILLALLGRIAIDVSVEPLVDAISQLPAEPAEVGLLRRAVEALEAAGAAPVDTTRRPSPTVQLPERIDVLIEESHHAVLDAVRRLTAATDELGDTMRSSVDAFRMAIDAAGTQPPPIADGAMADISSFTELQGAVESLTASIDRLGTLPATVEAPTLDADQAARRPVPEPRLARELRKLLQEIDAL